MQEVLPGFVLLHAAVEKLVLHLQPTELDALEDSQFFCSGEPEKLLPAGFIGEGNRSHGTANPIQLVALALEVIRCHREPGARSGPVNLHPEALRQSTVIVLSL